MIYHVIHFFCVLQITLCMLSIHIPDVATQQIPYCWALQQVITFPVKVKILFACNALLIAHHLSPCLPRVLQLRPACHHHSNNWQRGLSRGDRNKYWGCLRRGCLGKHLVGSERDRERDKVQRNGRRLHTEELREFHASTYVIRMIKSRKIRWARIWHEWERGEIHTGSSWGNVREKNQMEGPGISGGILEWAQKCFDGRDRSGLIWLRMRKYAGLCEHSVAILVPKMRGNFLPGEHCSLLKKDSTPWKYLGIFGEEN